MSHMSTQINPCQIRSVQVRPAAGNRERHESINEIWRLCNHLTRGSWQRTQRLEITAIGAFARWNDSQFHGFVSEDAAVRFTIISDKWIAKSRLVNRIIGLTMTRSGSKGGGAGDRGLQ